MMISVMGATGKTGGVVAARLLGAGQKVAAIGRSAERLQVLVDRGATAAVGDVGDVTFLSSAFQKADAVYAMIPPNYADPDPRGLYRRVGEAIAAALQRAQVPRGVFLSSIGAELAAGTGPIAWLHEVEERLKVLDLDLRILRPGYFYENFYGSLDLIRHQGINGGAIEPDVAIPMTAAADVGAAAADELLRGAFRGKTVRELLGPRDYTMDDTTRIIGEKIGRPDLRYVRFPDADFANALAQAGFARPTADAFVEMAHALSTRTARSRQGRSERTTMPTTFETFADQLAAAYSGLGLSSAVQPDPGHA
jgi:uncharacterized protein YbjT (DUF2867 family)